MQFNVPVHSPVRQHSLAEDVSTRELIVVSNRQPYAHSFDDGEITVDAADGGLTTGLEPFVRDGGGTWIAWGDGDADGDVVDESDRVRVPPEDPSYTLRRVWLSDEEVRDYYYGFSNRVLWPLCHAAPEKVHYERRYWQQYRAVNRRFADVVGEECRETGDPIVWFQDYHLALAPRMARKKTGDGATFMQFWHVPWPSWDLFRACPHGLELLRGMLGSDVVGFHVERYAMDFLECVERGLEGATVDFDRGVAHFEGSATSIETAPLGIDVERIARRAGSGDSYDGWRAFAERHEVSDDDRIAIGVERLDYSKGIPQRLQALERLWESRPQWRGAFTYVQNGTESRSQIPEYDALQEEVESEVNRVNARFGTDDWTPVVYTTEHLDQDELYGLYRRADLALVSPIRDGLNLVALEYVATQVEDPGVLVLSEGAGAHDLLGGDALSVSPRQTQEFSATVAAALNMARRERRWRMKSLQDQIRAYSLSNWVHTFLEAASTTDRQRRQAVGHER